MARVWLRAALAGEDGPGRRALPAGELLHPIALLALLVLLANDWLAKPSPSVPGWLTGKASDVAGLLAAPLCATAVLDCSLWLAARAGLARRVDFSLRRGRLFAATAACAAGFAAVKLSPAAAAILERAALAIGLGWRVVSDPTDLVALPAIAAALWIGRREIARVPLGRLEVLERRWRAAPGSVRDDLSDVVQCGGDHQRVDDLAAALEAYFAGGPAAPAETALRLLRRPGEQPGGSRSSPNTRP